MAQNQTTLDIANANMKIGITNQENIMMSKEEYAKSLIEQHST